MNNEGMFENVGGKIETYAKVCLFLCIGLAVIILLIGCANNNSYYGSSVFITSLITSVVLVIAGYIGSLMIYGYGKLIENVDEIKKILKEMKSAK